MPLQQTLGREYQRYNQAIKAKNLRAIMGMLTPDFSWHVGDGKALNRQQTRAALAGYLEGMSFVEQADFRIERISADSEQAARVIVTEKICAIIPAGSGSLQRRTTTETLQETWVRTKQGWKVRRSELLESAEALTPVFGAGQNKSPRAENTPRPEDFMEPRPRRAG